MKQVFAFFLGITACLSNVTAQQETSTIDQKGTFFIYWGWNRDAYTKSDIQFKGNDYDFELKNVIANDRQSPFSTRIYLNPKNISIPQYNLRLGYYFKNKYQVSFGVDHMKYVMKNDQTTAIDGSIHNSGTAYDAEYKDTSIALARDFLLFEHTDGLNYLNVELRRSDVLYARKNFVVSVQEGGGAGILIPKTNATLLGNPRHDAFHLSGYGLGVVGAVNFTFFNYFFLQAEAKGGFIHMPDIRTTMNTSDKASQHFCFLQFNGLFGARFNLLTKKKTN
jgi:hypothetical protein